MDEKPKILWKNVDNKYQYHVTISTIGSTIESENVDESIVYIEDLEKRRQAYGICGECNEPEGGYDFLNEIKSHLQIYINDIVQCYGITQDLNNKEYMMVLYYCEIGNLRNYLNRSKNYINYKSKIDKLQQIARGLLDIHNVEKVHKYFYSGNILFNDYYPFISDLEVLRGYQYTKAADIYSFGIVMNEFLSEEIPFNDIPHDEFLAIKICKGLRPTISEGVPKLLADLIVKCWNAEIKNGPTTKELYQTLNEWNDEISEYSKNSEDNKDDKSKSFQTHPQAFYISRLLNFKNLPKPVNSSDLSSCHFSSDNNYTVQSTSANPISECLDVQLSELELNEICQDSEHNIE
ncbi:uncharacterized protein OCT59_001652 [Rhizophagus irregularis]|uniref:uncharacterized protein n=1 Tax=Rhizophagus irregularis TaxID=588596 RepID=UPI00332A8D21|nr:hypothetical protein OCT59_001652 [Rhizophagus irregularis]